MSKSIILVGSPIVDSVSYVSDEFLKKFSIPKGIFSAWPLEKVLPIVKELDIDRIVAGGSAANTARGIAFLGAKARFFGKYSNDQFGVSFKQTLKDYNVDDVCIAQEDMITTTIFCLITPDGERTMLPMYGVSHTIIPSDVDLNLIKSSDYLLVDGYQFANQNLIDTVYQAIHYAIENGVKIISSLSNISCINDYFEHINYIVNKSDIVIGNYQEFMSLFSTKDDKATFKLLEDFCQSGKYSAIVATMDEKGAMIFDKNKSIHLTPKNMDNIIDLTGAGDFFAAGFLYGYLNGYNIGICGEIANILSADVISNAGPVLNNKVKLEVVNLLS